MAIKTQHQLSARNREVLQAIVREFIATGEPVASRTVARNRRDHLSAATIRNVMADLVDDGYLEQPHTSAGRIPTPKAVQFYVDNLVPRALPLAEIDRMRAQLPSGSSPVVRAEQTCRILTGLTRNLSITAAIPSMDLVLDRIELLSLGEGRVLFVVVTEDQAVHNKVVVLSEGVTQDDLNTVRNYINHHYSGKALLQARADLEKRLAMESALYDRLLARLKTLYQLGLLEVDASPEVFTEGTSYLLALDAQLTREKLQHLFQALEEKQRVLQLLDLFLNTSQGGVAAHVGLKSVHPALSNFSLIGASVRQSDGALTRIAVLGPMRMNYEKVISAIAFVRDAVSA